MADDLFSVFDQAFGAPVPDEEETGFAVGAPQDLPQQMFAVQRQISDNTAKQDAMRRQQLERATQMLQQRQIGPTLSERLLALSAAFAQPSRTRGLAGVLGNVMPVLAEQTSMQRQGDQMRADKLMELENAYQNQQLTGQQQSLAQQLALLKTMAQYGKQPRRRTGFNPITGDLQDMDTGEPIAGTSGPTAAHIAALRQHPERADEFDVKFGTGMAARILGAGGLMGSRPSGDFRNVPSGNPLIRP